MKTPDKLLSTTEMVDWLDDINTFPYSSVKRWIMITNYTKLMQRPLEDWMVVPCDEEGNVLEDPGLMPSYQLDQYRKAKERCWFDLLDEIEKSTFSESMTFTFNGTTWFSTGQKIEIMSLSRTVIIPTKAFWKEVGLL